MLLIRGTLLCAHAPTQAGGLSTGSASRFDPVTFAAELERLAGLLDEATESDAARLAADLPDRWHVSAGTETYELSTGWLGAALSRGSRSPAEWSARRTTIRSRLSLLSAEARALADPGSRRSFESARAALENVLKRREFQQGEPPAWVSAIERKIRQWIDALGRSLGFSRSGGPWAAIAAAWIAGLAALAGLIVWLIKVLSPQPSQIRLAPDPAADPRVSARDWALRSMAAMQGGDVKEAVRCAYNACLRRLEEQGIWRVDPARTAREYLRLVPHRHALRDTVADLTRQFERAWYGNQPLTADDAKCVRAHLETLGCLPGRGPAI